MPSSNAPSRYLDAVRSHQKAIAEFRCDCPKGRCQGPSCREQPPWSLPLAAAHIDHIVSGRGGSNADDNLRVLCRRCHVLRADRRHRGMIAAALRAGIIPPNWRELVWDDG